ncbi:MAG: hypothetical protein LC722_06950 [Actinobacteria bacterium]|nr:hypothetical protein [Actinomycetota bacterium]
MALVAVTACGTPEPPQPAPSPPGPYTVSAIDYHFHDAHPSRPIDLGRAVRFSNQGNNVHNVTFAGVQGFDRDLLVGGEIVIDPISSLVPKPGEYRFFCRYHRDRKMTGVLVVR